ncbi:MAG: NADPH:quinone oxidoreductase family protein [Pseudomonadales bacterium]|nr:NADPH:quinone oxidoreductase family protein [Pseudomonadales bacterium]
MNALDKPNLAAICVRSGSHLDLVVQEVPAPKPPGPGEIQVALNASGLNFSDLVKFSGAYQVQTPRPFFVGGEASGRVVAVGSSVQGLLIGDVVLVPTGCVRFQTLRASEATKVPDGIDLMVAASFRQNYQTAIDGLQRAQLRPGETLLVQGAAGGVGLAAVDIGLQMGARVIGVVSTEAKQAVVARYAADAILRTDQGFRSEVLALTQGQGADVVFDPVGGDVFDESVRCIAPFGRILVVGFASGRPALAKTNHLLVKDAAVIGYTPGGLKKKRPAEAERQLQTLMRWLVADRIKPFISHVLPLEEIQAGYQLIVDREVVGKVMIDLT